MPVELDRPLRILQVSTRDIGGGAERVAWNLFAGYREHELTSWLAVGSQHSDDIDVFEIPRRRNSKIWASVCWFIHGRLTPLQKHVAGLEKLCSLLRHLARGWRPAFEYMNGHEDFNFPGCHDLLQLTPSPPDLVHCHNLHGGYFDLGFLPRLSHQVPVILTLHDAWLLSGHCAHSLDCERWRIGCGHCPDLTLYPSILRDATAYNWQRKQRIYKESKLYIATPSQWLMRKVEQSILAPNIIDSRVVPNGVDLSTFQPIADKQKARLILGLPSEISILLFAANSIQKNVWKDYLTMQAAIKIVAERLDNQRVLFIALGEEASTQHLGNAEIRFVPYQRDPKVMAQYYQAADIYIHAARADTFPNVVLEALACGTPIVATAVGGIPEQVEDGNTGFLVPQGQSKLMADRIMMLLADTDLRNRMGKQAAAVAGKRFDINRQIHDYWDWYCEIIDEHAGGTELRTTHLTAKVKKLYSNHELSIVRSISPSTFEQNRLAVD